MSIPQINTDDLLDKPFKMGASGPDAYDCYHLCQEVCRRAGVYLPPKESIADIERRADALEEAKTSCIELEQPEPYCIVAIRGEPMHPDWITHMGIVLANRYQFIHIRRNHLVTIERLDHPYWRGKIEGYYRYVGP